MAYVVAYFRPDDSEVNERIIGIGGGGIVIEHGDFALKIPKLRHEVQWINGERTIIKHVPQSGDYDERQVLITTIMEEKAIYRRLGDHPGIVRCYHLDSPAPSIQMELMDHGDLRHYLATNKPNQQIQKSWLRSLASVYQHIHEQRVVVCDIRTDNILLNHDLELKVTDFGESVMMPLTWDLQGPVDLGWSISTDVGQFGTIIYEIVTGQHCKFDPFSEWKESEAPRWPRRDSLPTTDDIWLGGVIERCWAPAANLTNFTSMTEVLTALEQEFGRTS